MNSIFKGIGLILIAIALAGVAITLIVWGISSIW